MCHKCSLIRFNIGAEAEAGAGKHEGEGVLDLRLGGRIRSKEVSREISPLSRRELQVLMQFTAFMNLMFHTFLTSFFTVNLHVLPGLDLVSSTGIWAVNNPLIILVSPLPFLQHRTLQELSGWGQRSVLIPLSFDRVTPTPPHSISKDGDLCEPHQERKSSPQWIKRNNWWVQGQLSPSLLRMEVITFGFSHPLLHPSIPEAQIQSTLCWAMATWITIISTTIDESGRAQHTVGKYC